MSDTIFAGRWTYVPARTVQVGDVFGSPDRWEDAPERVTDVRPGRDKTVRIFTTRYLDHPYIEHMDNPVRIGIED